MIGSDAIDADPAGASGALAEGAASDPVGRIFDWLDRLITIYGRAPFEGDLIRAKQEYAAQRGEVFEDDGALFEERMAALHEWYLLERPLGQGGPPIEHALADATLGRDAPDRRALVALACCHHGLFEVVRAGVRDVEVRDLLRGAAFLVSERRSTVGFAEGDVFEGRVFWDGERAVFGRTLLFHPSDARAAVLAAVGAGFERGLAPAAVMAEMAQRHLRWTRNPKLPATRVYGGW